MLSCREVVEQASDFHDQQMNWRQRLQYRLHLLMCHHCRRFTRQFVAGVAMLAHLPRPNNNQPQIEKTLQRLDALD